MIYYKPENRFNLTFKLEFKLKTPSVYSVSGVFSTQTTTTRKKKIFIHDK